MASSIWARILRLAPSNPPCENPVSYERHLPAWTKGETMSDLTALKAATDLQNALTRDLCLETGLLTLATRGVPRGIATCVEQVFSQASEDGCLAYIFEKIGTKSRKFIEIGVGDGCENTTRLLLMQGWTGLWMEGDAIEAAKLRHNFADEIASGQLRVVEQLITAENVRSLITEADLEIDLLSVDIDMNTFYIWEALKDVKARVVCIEYNASFPPSVDFVVPYVPDSEWNRTNWFGASLNALNRLAREKSVSLVGCDFFGINAYFVNDTEAAKICAGPFTPEQHYQPPRYNLLAKRGHPPAPPSIARLKP
jgi:hypothetical protein